MKKKVLLDLCTKARLALRSNDLVLAKILSESLALCGLPTFENALNGETIISSRSRRSSCDVSSAALILRQRDLCAKFFDADYYRRSNEDVRASGIDALDHYITYGWKEGRDPSPDFNAAFYQKKILGSESPRINPLLHWVLDGCVAPTRERFSLRSTLRFAKHQAESERGSVRHGSFDIVVPIYNAYDDLVECIARLRCNTPSTVKVFLIDDASTDPRVKRFLKRVVSSDDRFTLLENKENQGFIKSVNIGLRENGKGKIILNTDAFVPKGWYERLIFPFSQSSDIATVTPFSNNAEIVNIPEASVATDLRPGEVDFIDSVASKLDAASSIVELPTGIGFCMALSATWLQRVPSFDTIFGMGYGEEVDWCQKVTLLGGKHVLASNLFVEHRGGKSFGDSKRQRIVNNHKIIQRRYPNYDAQIRAFMSTDPAFCPRFFLSLARFSFASTTKVYAAHAWGGGAELWLKRQLDHDLSDGYTVWIVRETHNERYLQLELHGGLVHKTLEVALDDLPQYLSIAPSREVVYSCLVGAKNPFGILHYLCGELSEKIKLTVCIHDYFPLCKSYNLLNPDGDYCDLPNYATCSACFEKLFDQSPNNPASISHWRDRWSSFLRFAEEIVVFSDFSRLLVGRVYPWSIEKIRVRPHKLLHQPNLVEGKKASKVLGILGDIGFQKGAAVLNTLASELQGEFSIVVIGTLDPKYRHINIVEHGRYQHEEITVLAERYGVVAWFVPSIWPETFSYTTHECLSTGLPTFVFEIGAQAEAIRRADPKYLIPLKTDPVTLKRIFTRHFEKMGRHGSIN